MIMQSVQKIGIIHHFSEKNKTILITRRVQFIAPKIRKPNNSKKIYCHYMHILNGALK